MGIQLWPILYLMDIIRHLAWSQALLFSESEAVGSRTGGGVNCLARLTGPIGSFGSLFTCSLNAELEMRAYENVACFPVDALVDLDAADGC
jgi:hypothetical protein